MALIVRMVKGQRVRHVAHKVVGKMRQNGWTVAEDPPAKPSRKRRSQPDADDQPSESVSEGFLVPEHKEES